MGLFSKKVICPICGKKVKGDVLIKIRDNVPLCKYCSAMVNMDAELIAEQSVEDMRAHLAYRERNLEKYENFQSTWDVKVGTSMLCVDETQKMWYCTRNRKDKNPPIFGYGEIIAYQYLEDGHPVVEEEKKGFFGSLFGEKTEPVMLHSMKVHIDLDNPYTRHIDVEAVAMNDEVKTGSFGYKSKRRSLDQVMEIMEGMACHAGGGHGCVYEEPGEPHSGMAGPYEEPGEPHSGMAGPYEEPHAEMAGPYEEPQEAHAHMAGPYEEPHAEMAEPFKEPEDSPDGSENPSGFFMPDDEA